MINFKHKNFPLFCRQNDHTRSSSRPMTKLDDVQLTGNVDITSRTNCSTKPENGELFGLIVNRGIGKSREEKKGDRH